jgi:2-polyprenyl-6-methoxyphenol hydroxylase-like FAD-dependent oxidoreductase
MHASPLLIAGGGIGGQVAAFALAQDGHQVTVLEQAAGFAGLKWMYDGINPQALFTA